MTIYNDYRFNQILLKNLIGKKFDKYKSDAFLFTNSVTGIIGLYIDKNIYLLTNQQETVDYYGVKDDMAIFKLRKCEEKDVCSAFVDTAQIETPINEDIISITLINENQKVDYDDKHYETDLTRAIIFHCESRNICFEKDMVAFSEEIIISRGHDLIKEYPKVNKFFQKDWDKSVTYSCDESVINIQN